MLKFTRRTIMAAVAATAMIAPAMAQDLPKKGDDVTFYCVYSPGGPTDTATRIVAEAISKATGINIQVVNKPGGSTLVGVYEMVRSKPDGRTLVATSSSTTTINYLNPERQAQFGREDFQPVALLARDPQFIYTPADGRFDTLKDLIQAAVDEPGSVTWGINAPLVPTHVMALFIEDATGARFTFVPFSGGAETTVALAGGQIDVAGSSGLVGRPFVEDGRLRVLAAVDEGEQDLFPDVKSAVDQGFQARARSYYGLLAPAGVDREILQFWNEQVDAALATEEVQERLANATLIPTPMTLEEYEQHWDEAEADSRRTLEILAKREE